MTEIKEVVETDVLFVGGGIASLSGALHLSNIVREHNDRVSKSGIGEKLEDLSITVLEKGTYPGAHSISGAVIDPIALAELVPDYINKGAPLENPVIKESVNFLTKNNRFKFPITPPMLNNHGNYVISISKLVEWLADLAEENEVDIYPEFAGTEILFEGKRVIGVGTGDKGIDKNGHKKANLDPGISLHSKITVFGEGSRGSLTKELINRMNLDTGKNPQNYVVGVKEVWHAPNSGIEAGEVIHTMGFPLPADTYGGGFIYGMKEENLALGLLIGLDYKDLQMDPHKEFQKLKNHSFFKDLLKEGKLVQWGAKTAPVGGLFAIPKMVVNGGIIIGDSAGLFISQKLKGIHAAIKSGISAAETILAALIKNDFSEQQLESYSFNLFESYVGKELHYSRNWHQAFQKGIYSGMFKCGLQYLLGGRIIHSRLFATPDYSHLVKRKEKGDFSPSKSNELDVNLDGKLTIEKEAGVYHSGTTHEEDQPPHLKIRDYDICYSKCIHEYNNPCVHFCPANVYDMKMDQVTGEHQLLLNPSNCVHCKTCDIKDPYENIEWTPPEGGGGPKYKSM